MRLAVLAEWELSLTEAALANPRASFDIAGRRLGLVFREQAGGRNQYVRYALAHAVLGPLLLAAAYEPIDKANERVAIALAHPYMGFRLAHSMTTAGLRTETKTVLSVLMRDLRYLLEVPHLSQTLNALRLVQALYAAALTDIDRELGKPENRSRLVDRALFTPFGDLKVFLAYVEATAKLKATFDALCHELGSDENRSRLADRALLTPLGTCRFSWPMRRKPPS